MVYKTIGEYSCPDCGVTQIAHTDAHGYECHGCGRQPSERAIKAAKDDETNY